MLLRCRCPRHGLCLLSAELLHFVARPPSKKRPGSNPSTRFYRNRRSLPRPDPKARQAQRAACRSHCCFHCELRKIPVETLLEAQCKRLPGPRTRVIARKCLGDRLTQAQPGVSAPFSGVEYVMNTNVGLIGKAWNHRFSRRRERPSVTAIAAGPCDRRKAHH